MKGRKLTTLLLASAAFCLFGACKTPARLEYATQAKTLDYLKRCRVLKNKPYAVAGDFPNETELANIKKDGGSSDYQVLFDFHNNGGMVSENYLFIRFWDCASQSTPGTPAS